MSEVTIEDLISVFSVAGTQSALKDVLSKDYLFEQNGYWRPPISFKELALLERVHPYHQLAINFERDKMVEYFLPDSLIPPSHFERLAKDFFTSGNCFYLKNRNMLGQVVATNDGKPAIRHLPFVYMRLMVDGRYCQVDNFENIVRIYNAGDVGHISEYDMLQNGYGSPSFIGQMQSIMFGEDSILTPRRELTDGTTRKLIALMGFTGEQATAFAKNLSDSKGQKEKTLVTSLPDKDGKKLDDIMKVFNDEASFGIDFEKFFRLTSETIIECHQIPWFLLGAQPDKGSMAPDLDKVERIYNRRILILQKVFERINEDVKGAVIFWKKPLIDSIYPKTETA